MRAAAARASDFLLAQCRPRGLRSQTAAEALRCLHCAGLKATQRSGRTTDYARRDLATI